MAKSKNGENKVSYSFRVNPDLLPKLKHLAIDENKTVSEIIEEGIALVLAKRKKVSR